MFVDHLPLVLYVGVLKHKAIKGVVVVVTVRFYVQRTSLIWALRCGFGVEFLLGVVC